MPPAWNALLSDPFRTLCEDNVPLQPRRSIIAPAAAGCKRLLGADLWCRGGCCLVKCAEGLSQILRLVGRVEATSIRKYPDSRRADGARLQAESSAGPTERRAIGADPKYGQIARPKTIQLGLEAVPAF